MTSILTNTSAMAALQTLRTVNAGLERTHQQVSSGLRVQTASDNAAYWSIATTMKSDNKANSAVADAIGLGAAKVDTAYAGIENTIDVVSEFRAKLVTAKESSIDKAKVQDELEQLKSQLLSTTASASFNGVNWLKTTAPENLAELSSLPDDVVSAFYRTPNGSVQVGKTEIDTADISVFNVGGGGSLQKDIRSLGDIGGFRNAILDTASNFGRQGWAFTGPVTLSGTDTISFDLAVDGGPAMTVTIDKSTADTALGTTDGVIGDNRKYALVLTKAFQDAGISSLAWVEWAGDPSTTPSTPVISIVSNEASGSTESSIVVSNVQQSPSGNAAGLADPLRWDRPGDYAQAQFDFTGAFRIYRDVQFTFDLTLPNTDEQHFVVDRDLVNAVLGTTDGWINSADDLGKVLDAAQNTEGGTLGNSGVKVSSSGGTVVFDIDSGLYPDKGWRSRFSIDNIDDNVHGPNFDILDVDITDPANDLDNYIDGLDMMLERVIKSGAVLGATQNRIDIAADFNAKLMDSIDSGVSRLVDADMEEASAKLSAQQTQQQLAIQSLQIANTNAENIMQLFQ